MERDFSEAFGRADYPLDGVHLVAASAGTGKTWNIGNLYARLLMARGLRVPQLLVVTFTEAATAELRERLRVLLGELQAALHGEAGGTDAESQAGRLVALLEPGEEARRRARDTVDLALLEFDRAAISTIHGFCGRALRRYAFESGLAFDAEPPGDVRAAQLETAARDWWRSHVALKPDGTAGFSLDELIEALKGPLGRADAKLDADLGGQTEVLETARKLLERWDAERADRKAPDFDDILLGMRAALRGERKESFAAALREEYAAVLVDEFQDTDPVQYGIFREAFLEGAGGMPVYFIGDPKQAIYAFRGGDIHAYRAAAEAVPEDRRWSLRENFRSAPKMVGAVNRLFRDGAGEGYTFGDASMAYAEEIRAKGDKRDIEDGGAAVQFAVADKDDDASVARSAACEIAVLLRAGTRLRTEKEDGTVEERALRPGDIAVLVRASLADRGKKIARQLREFGVRAIVHDKDSTVLRSAEAEAFRLLLGAFAEAAYAPSVRAALLTPFFGLDAASVAELAKPDGRLGRERCPEYPFLSRRAEAGEGDGEGATMTDFLRVFREWTDAWNERGFLGAFARMEADLAFRPRIASGKHGERALANVLHLAELVHAHVSATGAGPAAALDWYLRKSLEETGDEACLRLESDADAVQILTLHSSKGLEFPVTVLPDAWKRPGIKSGPWHAYHRREENGEWALHVGVSGEAEAAEAKEREEEEMRLLYVGLTRAAWRCIVLVPEDGGDIKVPAFRYVLERARGCGGEEGLAECRAARTPEDVAATGGAPDAQAPERWREVPPMPALPEPLGRGSYSSLSPGEGTQDGRTAGAGEARDLDAESGEAPADGGEEKRSAHPIFAFRGGTALGDCWHKIFEEADFRAGDAELRALAEKKLKAGGLLRGPEDVRAARTESVVAMVRAVLETEMGGREEGEGSFCLRDIGWEDRASEWEFDFSSRAAADTTARLRDILRAHWGGEPEESDHRAFLRTLEGWNRPIPKGFLMGFVDLLFRRGGRYYVLDWKSNTLGGRESAFSPAGLRAEMAGHAYFLQYLVYSAVVHRHLRASLPGYEWGRHFGGVRYVFLRGAAIGRTSVYADRPAEALLDDFADALGL